MKIKSLIHPRKRDNHTLFRLLYQSLWSHLSVV